MNFTHNLLMFGQRAHNMGINNEITPLYIMGKKQIEYQFFAEVSKRDKPDKILVFEFLCI